jgi:hypothetical protein
VTAAEVAPPGMVTVAGRLAMEVLLLASVIRAPAAGASPFRVTVAVEVAPPKSDAGVSFTESSATGFTVSVAPLVTVPRVAEIFTAVLFATA